MERDAGQAAQRRIAEQALGDTQPMTPRPGGEPSERTDFLDRLRAAHADRMRRARGLRALARQDGG